jgi:hypothetical protein
MRHRSAPLADSFALEDSSMTSPYGFEDFNQNLESALNCGVGRRPFSAAQQPKLTDVREIFK